MVGEERKYIRTWEELVMDRLGQAFHAKDKENAELFDSITEEIEMLLKLVPTMHNELGAIKEHKLKLLKEGMKKAEEKAISCPDEITKQFVFRKEVYTLEWDYRVDMLETILNILGAYQKIPFAQPEMTEMSAIKPVEVSETPEERKKANPEGKTLTKTPKFDVTD